MTSDAFYEDGSVTTQAVALTREQDARIMSANMAAPDLPTIKALAVKHKIDFRTLRRFFAGGRVRGALVRLACEKAARELARRST